MLYRLLSIVVQDSSHSLRMALLTTICVYLRLFAFICGKKVFLSVALWTDNFAQNILCQQ